MNMNYDINKIERFLNNPYEEIFESEDIDRYIEKGIFKYIKNQNIKIKEEKEENLKLKLKKELEKRKYIEVFINDIEKEKEDLLKINFDFVKNYKFKQNYKKGEDKLKKALQVDIRTVVEVMKYKGKCVYEENKDVVFYYCNRTKQYKYNNFKDPEDGGSSIDFLKKYKNMSFKEAINYLLKNKNNEKLEKIKEIFPEKKQEKNINWEQFIKNNINSNNYGSYRYLVNIRKIDKNIFKYLYDNSCIFRDLRGYSKESDKKLSKDKTLTYFVYKNPYTREITGLTGRENRDYMKYINKKPYTKNFSNTKWGFNLKKGKKIKKIYFFEAPIDLLSYLTIYKGSKKLNNSLFVATGGNNKRLIKENIEEISKHDNIEEIKCCFDNDDFGDNFYSWIYKKYKEKYKITREKSKNEDWNDDLQKIK